MEYLIQVLLLIVLVPCFLSLSWIALHIKGISDYLFDIRQELRYGGASKQIQFGTIKVKHSKGD